MAKTKFRPTKFRSKINFHNKKEDMLPRDLSTLNEDATKLLNIMLLELLRPAQAELNMSDEETIASGRQLLESGLITIVEEGDQYRLRVENKR